MANFKAFVSEKELDEQRQRRQEEWDKVRTADQPAECPEEEYDPRSLFDKLQEQKDKKQSDYEEQFKFKNMVRGIDDEESKFLNDVAERQMKIDAERWKEEKALINECKETVMNRTVPVASQSSKVPPLSAEKKVSSGNKRSQAALLAGAVKRKRPESTQDPPPPKQTPVDGRSETEHVTSASTTRTTTTTTTTATRPEKNGDSTADPASSDNNSSSESGDPISSNQQQPYCIAVLPGIGSYTNSSDDSDTGSSDSETPEVVKSVFHKGRQGHKKCADK